MVNLLSLAPNEKIMAILPVREFREHEFIAIATRDGVVKKTTLSELKNVRSSGIVAISIDEGDQLVSARLTRGGEDVFLCSLSGKSIRFNESDVRAMGRAARGVCGMTLEDGDKVVTMEVLNPSAAAPEILTVTEAGYGKRTPVEEYRSQSRGGKGIITMKTTERNGNIAGARQVRPQDDVMLVSNKGQMIRIRVGEISEQGRNTQGVRLMTMSAGERVVAFEYMAESAENGNGAGAAEQGSPEAAPEGDTSH